MKLRPTVSLLIVVLCMAFCVHCYKLRNTCNIDKAEKQIRQLNYEIAVLTSAISRFPEKDEGYVSFMMDKHPNLVYHPELAKTLGIEIETEDGEEVETENQDDSDVVSKFSKPAQFMNDLIDGF